MTDLEQHVNAKGRKELVKQVREKIKELGIQYIYYQFVSVTGRIVGKGVPSDHWETVAERGFQILAERNGSDASRQLVRQLEQKAMAGAAARPQDPST